MDGFIFSLILIGGIIYWLVIFVSEFWVPITLIIGAIILVLIISIYASKKEKLNNVQKIQKQAIKPNKKIIEYEIEENSVVPDKEYFYILIKYEDLELDKVYCYISNDYTIKVGDRVLLKRQNKIVTAKVTDTRYYRKDTAPFPVEKTRFIIRKVDENFNVETDITEEDKDFNDVIYKKVKKKVKREIQENIDENDLDEYDIDDIDDLDDIDDFVDKNSNKKDLLNELGKTMLDFDTIDYVFGNKEFDSIQETFIKQNIFNKAFNKDKKK